MPYASVQDMHRKDAEGTICREAERSPRKCKWSSSVGVSP